MKTYNYDAFSTQQYELNKPQGPVLGSKAPDGDVTLIDGRSSKLLDFEAEFLVLELGSITCPLFQGRREIMESLLPIFPQASFKILYVREAHPGARYKAHHSSEDKVNVAQDLSNFYKETREILVDDFEGTLHQAYGSLPNALYIINQNGCIVYKNSWNNARGTQKALSRLVKGDPAGRPGIFLPGRPDITLTTLRRAGKGATKDFLKGLPHLVWHNLIIRNSRLLRGKTAAVGPKAVC